MVEGTRIEKETSTNNVTQKSGISNAAIRLEISNDPSHLILRGSLFDPFNFASLMNPIKYSRSHNSPAPTLWTGAEL
jgi:hypothetical protein